MNVLFGMIQCVLKLLIVGILQFIYSVGCIVFSVYYLILDFVSVIYVLSILISDQVRLFLFGHGFIHSIIYITFFGVIYIVAKYIPIIILALCENLKESLI